MNLKPFGAESNLIYRNELNRPAKGVHTGGRAGGAARKEVTIQTHGHDKYDDPWRCDPARWGEPQTRVGQRRLVLVILDV